VRRELPSGTVTFLFTDIEGSTRLLHELGPEAYADALAEHRRVLRTAFTARGGVEVDTQGDAFFVAFPTAIGGADAALAARDALAAGPVSVRMGLHTGTPTLTGEGYVGSDVHRSARVAALAHGGQIVVSPATAALLDGSGLRDLGLHRLKDFEAATRLYQLGDGDFSPLRTPGSVDLPTPATRFLGRERELFDAVSLVYQQDPRVLTILGPGGTGKTRFAIELARLLADEADGGTVFVPFAPVHDSGLVGQTVADRLGATDAEPTSIASVVGPRATHLVLDNLEHLLPLAASMISAIVTACPALRVLATSREALRIQGEVELDLPPLAANDAMTLFLQRARAVRSETEETPAVSELCARLDHLPLALELAAARTKLLTPEQLLGRLTQRLDLLRGTRDADDRHATLRTTIAWSYDLLDHQEQELFAGLSVFAAGCTLESAESVCDADLDTLASLLDKSLTRRRTGRLGEERYWMLETIREFARECLDARGAAGLLQRRHAERMLAIAQATHLSEDDDEPFQFATALAERDDLRAALDWATEHDPELALELAVSLENFWNAHAPDEGRQRFELLLARTRSETRPLRASAHRAYGGTLDLTGAWELAWDQYEESLSMARRLGDERGIASATHRLAMSAASRGQTEQARRLAEESLRVSAGRFPYVDIPNLTALGRVHQAEGETDRAMELLRTSADQARDIGWLWWVSGTLDQLALMELETGDVSAAARDADEALRLERDQENRHWARYSLTILARIALTRGQLERAGTLWGAVECESSRAPHAGWEARGRTRYAGPLLDEARPEFVNARDCADLDLWHAVAIALDEDELPQTVP
jgi:predicted ATPase/class 3 adenylate cyclase